MPIILSLLLAAALPIASSPAPARTILFVGNSFTFGAGSPVQRWNAASVTDLNRDGIGGVPALFKRFAEQAGLDYTVSLETAPGRGLGWHRRTRLGVVDRRWDHVVLQDYSTLDAERAGDATATVDNVTALARVFRRHNPRVDIDLFATWSRPDLVHAPRGRWAGKPIAAMAIDLRRAYDRAARAAALPAKSVMPVGEAFTCAIRAGVADPDPYDGLAPGRVDLWGADHYHASVHGSYLSALVMFAQITGRDPRALGRGETAAAELGIAPEQAVALQRVARDALVTDGGCGR